MDSNIIVYLLGLSERLVNEGYNPIQSYQDELQLDKQSMIIMTYEELRRQFTISRVFYERIGRKCSEIRENDKSNP